MSKNFIIGAFIIIVTIVLPFIIPKNLSLDKLSVSVLLGTMIVIIWYTIEANLMQKAAHRQVELSVRPFIFIFPHYGGDKVEIKNLGNGVALDINVLPIIISEESEISLKFEDINYLEPGESAIVEVKTFSGGRETDFDFRAHIDPRYANRSFHAKIHFKDIDGKKRNQTILLGKGGPKLIDE